MKINFELDTKLIVGVAIGASIVCGALFIKPIRAQAVTSLSGQYGCIVNKNFAGATVSYETGSGITGSNYMMYLDFTKSTGQLSVVGWDNWGAAGLKQDAVVVTGAGLTVASGPLTNSFVVTGGTGANATQFYMMSVNGGTTLLVQSGYPNSGNGEPLTGVCNKI